MQIYQGSKKLVTSLSLHFKQYSSNFSVCLEKVLITAFSFSNGTKRHRILDEGGETGAVLTDLSKAFDCIDHNLLIAKLNTYGFEKQSINFIYSYLTKCKQRTKTERKDSVLRPLLFNKSIVTKY